MSLKNSSDTIGNRTRDLPVCSVVPQPLRHRSPHQVCVCVCVYIYVCVCVCVCTNGINVIYEQETGVENDILLVAV
jgi:hypothetical protein